MNPSLTHHPRWTIGLLLAGCLFLPAAALAAEPLNLDAGPRFDFTADPARDPAFTPERAGLTEGQPGFATLAGVQALAVAIDARFPPATEVLVAYWGNPGYAVLAGTAQPPTPAAAGSVASLARGFHRAGGAGGAGGVPEVVPGRSAGAMEAEGTEVILGGVRYQLPGPELSVSPLVLDLDGDGQLGASRGLWQPHPGRLTGPYAAFDMDGDGFPDVTEWVGPEDGLLVSSATPAGGRDLVGTVGGWRDGFEQLGTVFDLDRSGRVEGPELDRLYVWQDRNTNGVAEPGEVTASRALGLEWIAVAHRDYVSDAGLSSLGGSGAATRTVWDWWPNYARALRRGASPAAGSGLRGYDPLAAVREALFRRVPEPGGPPVGASLSGPEHFAPAVLADAGVELATFRVALLANSGRALLGYDAMGVRPGHSRLLRLDLEKKPPGLVAVPCDGSLFQIATDAAGRQALVLTEAGSRLALVDFETGSVVPPGGLELRSIGLRASGIAGHCGTFWFTAWQLDDQGLAVDEAVWALTPWGLWPGRSLQALKAELGPLRSHYITGPDAGFFATPGAGGAGETLWWVTGTNRVVVAQADSFGGLYATPAGGAQDAGGAPGGVAYTQRVGDVFTFASWRPGPGTTVLGTSRVPFFYPFLSEGGGTAIAAQLALESQTIHYLAAPDHTAAREFAGGFPGQAKVARGVFATYGTNGVDLLPLPDAPPPVAPGRRWTYTLLPESRLIEDCSGCGRGPVVAALRGTFQLRLLDERPGFATYALEDLNLEAGGAEGARYTVRGRGLYHLGREAGRLQELCLEVQIESPVTNRLCRFLTRDTRVERAWPLVHGLVDQVNSIDSQTFTLELSAAPFRDLWYSTLIGMTPAAAPAPADRVGAGDLVSIHGGVVMRREGLLRPLGLAPAPTAPEPGLDAVTIGSGSELLFSLAQPALSETLGALQEGDLLSAAGRVVARNQELTRAFPLPQPAPDLGLDAVQARGDGEILFSIKTPGDAGGSGRLGRGDLLSNRGRIVKSNAELLARFQPVDPRPDYGLDAFYVWPGGEIWFSTEEGFADLHAGFHASGDVLSDQGYVVMRNRDLVAALAPLEEVADFGCDALHVVFGAHLELGVARSGDQVEVSWEALEAILEESPRVEGPWQDVPLGLVPGTHTVAAPVGSRFFRLRQP